VLDLACGTGVLTRQLAARAESVVGLDVSEPMLREARSRTDSPRVRYARGDFRDFDLGEPFDAAVCGGDSLNYLGSAGELGDVLRCVRRHLRPGGLFAFDALDHRAFAAGGGRRVIATVGADQFDVYYFYNPAARVGESRAVFPGAVERHRRVPLEEADVRRAASDAGLVVVEHFGERSPFWWWELPFKRDFYVLRSG
jgi:SAM-dependent methyltransferase